MTIDYHSFENIFIISLQCSLITDNERANMKSGNFHLKAKAFNYLKGNFSLLNDFNPFLIVALI